VPEGYAIEKDGNIYYAFYAPEKTSQENASRATPVNWDGEIELRGLSNKQYRVLDYVNGKDYGTLSGPTARLHVAFQNHLLLEAAPAAAPAARTTESSKSAH